MAEPDSIPTPGFHFDAKKNAYRVQIQQTFGGKRIRKSRLLPKGTTAEEASEIAEAMRADAMGQVADTSLYWERSVERAKGVRGSWVWCLWDRARKRSKHKGRTFEITIDDVAALCIASRGRCALTGVTLQTLPEMKRMRPFSPSLDRIDASLGYVKGNCRVVCMAVNLAMFTWGEEAFRQIAIGYVMERLRCPESSHPSRSEP